MSTDTLFDRIRDTLGDTFDEFTGWEPATTPDGTIAWRCRAVWEGGPPEVVFFLNDVTAWQEFIRQTDESYVAGSSDDSVLVSASLQGGRVKFVVHDGADWWTSRLMPLGNPGEN